MKLGVTLLGLSCVALGCGSSTSEGTTTGGNPATHSTYVLVHGAFAGGYSWDKVKTALEANGDTVEVVDLPAHGADMTPVAGATLETYTKSVVSAIDAATEPVVLVGHSMGGIVISQAAEARSEKVKKLVYVAAVLIGDGKAMLTETANDSEAKLGGFLQMSADGATITAKDGWIQGAFCQDCSADDVATIKSHERPEPLAPIVTPIHVTPEKWGKVPRIYIHTTKDETIGPKQQQKFIDAFPCEKVISIESGHCPFLTKPADLTSALIAL
jgi:pimeloyl-ACP methyl ester carboxylesterase